MYNVSFQVSFFCVATSRINATFISVYRVDTYFLYFVLAFFSRIKHRVAHPKRLIINRSRSALLVSKKSPEGETVVAQHARADQNHWCILYMNYSCWLYTGRGNVSRSVVNKARVIVCEKKKCVAIVILCTVLASKLERI